MSDARVSVRCPECGNPTQAQDVSALVETVREVLGMDWTDPEQRAEAFDLLVAAMVTIDDR